MVDSLGRKLMRIRRDGDEWRFTWSQGASVYTLKDNERAMPQLPAVLEALSSFAIDAIVFIEKKFHEKVIVHGVDFDWKGDDNRRNGVVHIWVNNGAQGLTPIPTPKKLADNAKKEAKKPRWDEEAVKLFDQLSKQAFAYIDGERSQQTMPLMEDGAKKGKANGKKLDGELG